MHFSKKHFRKMHFSTAPRPARAMGRVGGPRGASASRGASREPSPRCAGCGTNCKLGRLISKISVFFCKKICARQHFSSSTRLEEPRCAGCFSTLARGYAVARLPHLCTAPNSLFRQISAKKTNVDEISGNVTMFTKSRECHQHLANVIVTYAKT